MKQILFLLFAVTLFTGCSKQDVLEEDNPQGIDKGRIAGKIVTANNTTPVRNAIVFIADGANIYYSFTDVNGFFNLEAPTGQRILNIQSGSGSMFRTTMNVSVEKDQTMVINSAVQLNQVASLAYLPGTYDKIQAILMDSLGYTATMINTNDLHIQNNISQYNAVFINCSSNMQVDYVQDSVLATYVANGGSIYASDYAVAMLIGTYGSTCPNPRMGGFIHDSMLCTQRVGNVGMLNNASIVSPTLQAYLNKNFMDVKYDLPAWEMVMNYNSSFWEVMVKHPFTQAPLLMRTGSFTNSSAGTINIGSGNTNMVTICHKPQGATPITITIPAADLAAHLAHGDSQGSCQSANGAGRIYYTTFHTEPNGLISPDMKHILEYIILNL